MSMLDLQLQEMARDFRLTFQAIFHLFYTTRNFH